MSAPVLCFVLAPGQNHFFVEVAEALEYELAELGVSVSISRDGFPQACDDLAYVLIPPHEYRWLAPLDHRPTPRQLERTIFYCLEQPGTSYFEEDVRMGRGPVGAVLDINEVGVREQRRAGVRAHHAPLGWTAAWSHADPLDATISANRDIDFLHLGIHSPRRGRALASSADRLARWRSRLVLGDDHGPNAAAQANFAIESEKWELLGRSRALLNIHVGERSYFEWLRVVQAICNGVLVVSEHSTGTAPLRAGEHFVSGRADALVALAEPLLEDEERRAQMACDAASFLREQQPLRETAEVLAELAGEVVRRPAGPRARQGALMLPECPGADTGGERAAALARTVALHGLATTPDEPDPADSEPDADTKPAPWPPGAPTVKTETSNEAPVATATTRDYSSDEIQLLSDPECDWLPTGQARLQAALENDSGAAFAWGMIVIDDVEADIDIADGPALRNVFPWQPWRLASGWQVERPVLWRTLALRELRAEVAGDGTDVDLYRAAAMRGLRGAHVPEIVARLGSSRLGASPGS